MSQLPQPAHRPGQAGQPVVGEVKPRQAPAVYQRLGQLGQQVVAQVQHSGGCGGQGWRLSVVVSARVGDKA